LNRIAGHVPDVLNELFDGRFTRMSIRWLRQQSNLWQSQGLSVSHQFRKCACSYTIG
jgi:hypothetical protein